MPINTPRRTGSDFTPSADTNRPLRFRRAARHRQAAVDPEAVFGPAPAKDSIAAKQANAAGTRKTNARRTPGALRKPAMSGPGGAGTASGTGAGTGPGTGHRRPPLRNYTACRPAKAGSNHGAATGGATASLTSVTDSQIDGAATSGPFVSNSSVNNTLAYDRMRDLPRLLRLWPKDIETLDRPGLQSLVERLEKALRAERRRGIARHWGYDLGRHAALLRAYRGECACLAQTPA